MKGKFFLFFSVILALGILIIQVYKDENIRIRPLYKSSTMRGLHITRKERGRVSWELKAEDAVFSGKNDEVVITSLRLKLFNEPELYVTGGSGVYNLEREMLVLNRPVEMKMSGGRFTTDSLIWNGKSGTVTTDDGVTFSSDTFHIEGEGLSAKIKEKKMMILRNVKGTFYL